MEEGENTDFIFLKPLAALTYGKLFLSSPFAWTLNPTMPQPVQPPSQAGAQTNALGPAKTSLLHPQHRLQHRDALTLQSVMPWGLWTRGCCSRAS